MSSDVGIGTTQRTSTTIPYTRDGATDTYSSRERLLTCGKRLIAKFGYEYVSTAAIAQAAGASEFELLQQFGTKAGLLETILNESWKPLNTRFADIVMASVTVRDAAIAILAAMIHVLERDPELAKLMLFESRRQRGDTEIRLSKGFMDFIGLLIRIVERGQKDGSFTTSLEPTAITSALMGAAEGMVRDRLLAELQNQLTPFSQAQLRSTFEVIVAGLAP
jgi:AcrR family transcriptional regulator